LIIGTGTDLANIDRINKVLTRYGDRFRNRVFTKNEQAKAKKRKDEAGTLAQRWAAKEACSKALGTGLRMGISWTDMALSNMDTGQPVMTLTGWAKKRLLKLTPQGYLSTLHVSLTDDHPWAHAIVIIDAQPLA
jgi:holo-[acyl-carrier protein] synthase